MRPLAPSAQKYGPQAIHGARAAPDHVLWGTDSIWWGSPQWQIEAMCRLEMPAQLMTQFGYKPLTVDVKRKIFGLNAAHLYGVDPKAKRNAMPADYIDRLKQLYKQAGGPMASNTQYGWVAAGVA